MQRNQAWSRHWRISWRETRILLKEFRRPVSLFLIAIIGFGFLYFFIARTVGEPLDSLSESMYLMLSLAFLQPNGDFPKALILQVFYFTLPIIGVISVAQGLADFGVMLFNRRSRSKEWEMAVASTYKKHTVLVGLGHLGYRVVERLHAMQEDVAVIEKNPAVDTLSIIQKLGIPIIQADASHPGVLEASGIQHARTIILCSQNDSINLQIAVKARSINPTIRVVIRIFDDDFAQSLQDQFGFIALSGTGMAAPVFAAAAAGADITNPISIEGQPMSLARLTISNHSVLSGQTVGYLEDHYHLSVVLVRQDHNSEFHPKDDRLLASGDTLAVLGGPESLYSLLHDNP